MNVLHFFKTYEPLAAGGIERVISELCRSTSKLGVKNSVLTLSNSQTLPISDEAHDVHFAPIDINLASTPGSARAIFKFRELASQADLVHYHFPWPFMDIVHFVTNCKKPTILTYHSDIVRQKALMPFYRPLMKKFLLDVDRIVATSPNYAKTSPILLNLSRKVDIVPIGLDPLGYERPSPDLLEMWRAKLPARFFLFVGTLRYYKGLHILIDAAAENSLPTVIVGAGPMEEQLKKRVARLGLTNVMFLGRLPEHDKIALLELCHSVVFPSHLRSEAFGVGLLEGAMFGKPLISSEIGSGTSFVNAAGQSGIVVPPSEPLALAEAMRRLWDDPLLARDLGQGALKRFNNYFTAAAMAQAYVHIYDDLADKQTWQPPH